MKAKFRTGELVTVAGDYTRTVSIKGRVKEVKYCRFQQQFMYDVNSIEGRKFYVAENFLSITH